MTIFVPPAVLGEVQTVLNSPMPTDVSEKVRTCDLIGIDAADVVTHIMRYDRSAFGAHLAVDTQRNLAARQFQCLPDVIGIV